MNILFLYGNEKALKLADWLTEQGHIVICKKDRVDTALIFEKSIEFIVSYTYRLRIQSEIVKAVNGNAVNLHISYLPWNKGADPNIWSWIDDTPKGVSIHFVSDQIDEGDIIAQREVKLSAEDDTLSSSYDKLMDHIIFLFQEIFEYYDRWNEIAYPQVGVGTTHFSTELLKIKANIDYHIPICSFIEEIKISVRAKNSII